MSQRLVLMGAAEGPWCGIEYIRRPVLRVRGLQGGRIDASIQTKESTVPFLMSCDRDGDYPLGEHSSVMMAAIPSWIQCSASAPTKSLICTVVSQAA